MSRRVIAHPTVLLGLFVLLVYGIQQGCTPEPENVRIIPNQPPETVVSGAPLDSANAFHRFHLFWAGFDPDGTVERYFVATADSNFVPAFGDYRQTTRTDSIIVFTANNEVVLSHSFWVYAVDNEGARDQTPARIFFNAVDSNRPIPAITGATVIVDGVERPMARNDTIPSSGATVTIRWTATDPDIGGSISAYRIKLNTESQFVEIPADSTSATYGDLPSGNYQFLVDAVDNAGAKSLAPATWEWIVNKEPDTRITQMFVANVEGFFEITDFRANRPTIRDSSRVFLFFEGSDEDGFVAGYQTRVIRRDILRGSIQSFPFGSAFEEPYRGHPVPGGVDTNGVFFTSNDWWIAVRSIDNEGKADGRPDSLFFSVNFAPSFDVEGVSPGPGDVISVPANPDEPLTVRFRATDVETETRNLAYRVILDGQFGTEVSQVPSEALLFEEWPFPSPGMHEVLYTVRDSGRRTDTLLVNFEVIER